jgi:hypothetical protein
MLLCYVFAKSETGNNRRVTDLAREFLARQTQGRFPTSEEVCATLEGDEGAEAEYQFFLRFKYGSLNDVARTVLRGRCHFAEHLTNTLTMLEYPVYSPNDRAVIRASALLHANTAGIILVRSNLGALTIRDKRAILDCCRNRELTCVDVLGPYDFVVEFPASTMADVNAMLAHLRSELEGRIAKAIPLFCRVFHGGGAAPVQEIPTAPPVA